MEEELYKENILEHYKNPQNKGELKGRTSFSRGINPSCGDVLALYVKEENGKIIDAMFDGEGCAISTAGASMLTEYMKAKSVSELKKINEEKVYKMLGVSISPSREKCALLCFNAMNKIIKKYN